MQLEVRAALPARQYAETITTSEWEIERGRGAIISFPLTVSRAIIFDHKPYEE